MWYIEVSCINHDGVQLYTFDHEGFVNCNYDCELTHMKGLL